MTKQGSAGLLSLPEDAPKMGNRFTQAIGGMMLKAIGWRIEGRLPNEAKLVICGAPHTSNWDFVVAMFLVLALGVKISYLMKKEAFVWPFKRIFLSLGGIPIDRKASTDTVEQIDQWYKSHDRLWVCITPEGTRSKVDTWKTGFLRIAENAQIPVFLVAWNYPTKTIYLDKCWPISGDHVKDAAEIRGYINRVYTGANPENQ
ncbi:MAG: 1-acyl-sn-glycerol-3-phosphate acyltransferase [Lentisphaeria bacterium]|jgi:1-acyl-sn-glycerol-3-phosphate acyltransferase